MRSTKTNSASMYDIYLHSSNNCVIALKDSGLGDLYTLLYGCTGIELRPVYSTMYVHVDVLVWD